MSQVRLLVAIALVGVACNRQPPPPVAPSVAVAEPDTTAGEIAGVRYLEHMTGGARRSDRVPMIVVLHPMGGDPEGMLPLFARFGRRARLILPYGHPSGGMYLWYDSVREDVAAPVVTREADRLAAAIVALAAARPTVGKPLVTGFSQGGIMTFALAVTHPEAMSGAFPISGMLPPSLYPSATMGAAKLPPIFAFHGAADLAVPATSARASIAALRSAGFTAELREYPGVEHGISEAEDAEILAQLGRAAGGLVAAAAQ